MRGTFPSKDVLDVLGYRFHRDGKCSQGADRMLYKGHGQLVARQTLTVQTKCWRVLSHVCSTVTPQLQFKVMGSLPFFFSFFKSFFFRFFFSHFSFFHLFFFFFIFSCFSIFSLFIFFAFFCICPPSLLFHPSTTHTCGHACMHAGTCKHTHTLPPLLSSCPFPSLLLPLLPKT